jgi:protein involved in polysaccharide export with SLBB domain
MRTLACLALLVISFVASTPALAQERPAGRQEQAVLTPGDSVRIVVWRKPEFSGDFVIAQDGSITHPLFRGVKVAGLPFATAEANLRQFLSGFDENPQFVMEPLIRVAVSGEVPRPSVFALRPETTIGEALARAGGTGPNGAPNRVRVIRLQPNGTQQQLRLNLADPNGSEGTTPVRSGDQIIVDRKKSFFRDILLPAITVIGSVASLGLLIDRVGRNNNN